MSSDTRRVITRHYAATSATHGQTDSAPLQKSGSPPPGATEGLARQHQSRQRQHQRPDRHRPTSGPRRAAGRVEAVVAVGARRVRAQILEVEAAAAGAVEAVGGVVPRLPRERCR